MHYIAGTVDFPLPSRSLISYYEIPDNTAPCEMSASAVVYLYSITVLPHTFPKDVLLVHHCSRHQFDVKLIGVTLLHPLY